VLVEMPPRPTMVPESRPAPTSAEPDEPQLDGRCILYVGRRCQLLPHLRAGAESWNACLLHHDGG
jgi:hypothetical protein